MNPLPRIISAVAVAVAGVGLMTVAAPGQRATGGGEITKKGIALHPGTKLSKAVVDVPNKVLAKYDEPLYRIEKICSLSPPPAERSARSTIYPARASARCNFIFVLSTL